MDACRHIRWMKFKVLTWARTNSSRFGLVLQSFAISGVQHTSPAFLCLLLFLESLSSPLTISTLFSYSAWEVFLPKISLLLWVSPFFLSSPLVTPPPQHLWASTACVDRCLTFLYCVIIIFLQVCRLSWIEILCLKTFVVICAQEKNIYCRSLAD